MPEKKTLERARNDRRRGKAATTQAGEFVREEMHHVREGKHGARSRSQAVAIGLSKARRSGVKLPGPGKSRGRKAARTDAAEKGSRTGTRSRPLKARKPASRKRSAASLKALRRERKAV
jgi:hypothetical protein